MQTWSCCTPVTRGGEHRCYAANNESLLLWQTPPTLGQTLQYFQIQCTLTSKYTVSCYRIAIYRIGKFDWLLAVARNIFSLNQYLHEIPLFHTQLIANELDSIDSFTYPVKTNVEPWQNRGTIFTANTKNKNNVRYTHSTTHAAV